LPVKAANLNFIWIDKRKQKGVFQIFAGRNIQRIEIRWNNMLPSRWLLPFHLPEPSARSHILAWDFNPMRKIEMRPSKIKPFKEVLYFCSWHLLFMSTTKMLIVQ
jgi:hypothetical protein